MATQIIGQPVFDRSAFNTPPILGGPEEPWIKETASQTYKAGDLVYWDTNGTVAICTASSNQHSSAILGQAMVAATGVTGNATRVRPIRPGDTYLMNLFHTTTASAVGTDATIGSIFGIWQKTTTLEWLVDLISTVEATTDTHGRVRVVGTPLRGRDGSPNAITDIFAYVKVMFLQESVGLNTADPTGYARLLQYYG